MATEKIFICGDPHGVFEHIVEFVMEQRPAAVILLGDMVCGAPLDQILDPIRAATDVWFIHGNHDTDRPEFWSRLAESDLADRNLHGRVVDIQGIKVAGLGGVFREEVWLPPAPETYSSFEEFARAERRGERRAARSSQGPEGNRLKHRSTIFPQTYSALMKQRADMLVCHQAPSCHPEGYAAIDELAVAMGTTRLFHGHQHDNLDYSAWIAKTGIGAYGVGLRGITDYAGQVVVPGELDAARRYRYK